MCGRFNLIAGPSELSELFAFSITDAPPPRYNIAPTQPISVARIPAGVTDPTLDIMHWGLIPFWAKDPQMGARMINARGETIGEKPAFRNAAKYRRCLIPASGFYEWKKYADRKQPMHIKRRDGKPFAFAGLWEHWQSSDGSEILSCAIITAAASPFMAEIHARMPVVLRPADFGLWLDPLAQKAELVQHLLRQFPDDEMIAEPIGAGVNSPRNDGPEVLKPMEIQGQMTLLDREADHD
ncbi:MAG: SOS response-associated peptidase [Candidatus Lernaella stagnicola]|nr:SOS response-associated peptidase [Candidatus Lernaella stagnicola]